jgi:hypothetical protein
MVSGEWQMDSIRYSLFAIRCYPVFLNPAEIPLMVS